MLTLTPASPRVDVACTYCDRSSPIVALLDPRGATSLHACPRCLRTLVLRKADLSEPRSERLLEQYAEENGLQVWCTADVAYALPPITRT